MSSSRTLSFLLPPPLNLKHNNKIFNQSIFSISTKAFSITATSCPLQYDMIINLPTQSPQSQTRPRPTRVNSSNCPENQNPDRETGFDNWVDKKLSLEKETKTTQPSSDNAEMTKSMRKYYNERRKQMYGSDSDDEYSKNEEGYVELRPEVVEFNRLHKLEEELDFYDAFACPWEKDKHYKMVCQLEKKYFPDECLDKAFLDLIADQNVKKTRKKVGAKSEKRKDEVDNKEDDKKLLFFDDQDKKSEKDLILGKNVDVKGEVSEKKVEEFFKRLKKVPKEAAVDSGEPYVLTRSTELPPTWDGPFGTMVLVNKPKGWTSFTVCGKLRRLVKVKKVGHAGTLDPMATGLLIVCIGKATKLVERKFLGEGFISN